MHEVDREKAIEDACKAAHYCSICCGPANPAAPVLLEEFAADRLTLWRQLKCQGKLGAIFELWVASMQPDLADEPAGAGERETASP